MSSGYSFELEFWCPPNPSIPSLEEKVKYRYKCDRVDCEDEYITESGKPLQKDLKNT